jgi:RsiW-degrading membrane proteinase PrsW (M82 family)
MKESKSVFTKLLIVVLILALIFAGCLMIFVKNQQNLYMKNGIIAVLIIVIALVFIIMTWKQFKDAKRGKIIEDEMTREIELRAGYYAFRFSIFFWIFLMLLNLITREYTDELLIIGVLIPALLHIFWKLYLTKTGNID